MSSLHKCLQKCDRKATKKQAKTRAKDQIAQEKLHNYTTNARKQAKYQRRQARYRRKQARYLRQREHCQRKCYKHHDESSDSSDSFSVGSDDSGRAEAQRELENAKKEGFTHNVRGTVYFTTGPPAPVFFNHYNENGDFYWTWPQNQPEKGFYSIRRDTGGKAGVGKASTGILLIIDKEQTKHSVLDSLGFYVKGSGAATGDSRGLDETVREER